MHMQEYGKKQANQTKGAAPAIELERLKTRIEEAGEGLKNAPEGHKTGVFRVPMPKLLACTLAHLFKLRVIHKKGDEDFARILDSVWAAANARRKTREFIKTMCETPGAYGMGWKPHKAKDAFSRISDHIASESLKNYIKKVIREERPKA